MVMVTRIISCIPAHTRCCTKHFLCIMFSQNPHSPMKLVLVLLPFYG